MGACKTMSPHVDWTRGRVPYIMASNTEKKGQVRRVR